jgi:hypothetical protein
MLSDSSFNELLEARIVTKQMSLHGVHCAGMSHFSIPGASRQHFSREVAQLFRRKFRR